MKRLKMKGIVQKKEFRQKFGLPPRKKKRTGFGALGNGMGKIDLKEIVQQEIMALKKHLEKKYPDLNDPKDYQVACLPCFSLCSK